MSVTEINIVGAKYIQQQSNWCWAVACRIVGEQYKKIQLYADYELASATLGDISQEKIVENANTTMPGIVDNFPGDDEAKIRGLKYVVTGNCNSDLIEVINVGTYDMPESLFELYGVEIEKVFDSGNYIIGNAVLFPRHICHSFVLMGTDEERIQVFDPWNASISMYKISDVFEYGFASACGVGVIKWMQYING